MEKKEIQVQELLPEEFSFASGEEEKVVLVVVAVEPLKTITLHRNPNKPLHPRDSIEPSSSVSGCKSTREDKVDEEPPSTVEDSGRERLKRHRMEVAGNVKVPDKWSQEELLKEWIDYSTFDALLAPEGLASAREALIAERRRARGLRIQGMC